MKRTVVGLFVFVAMLLAAGAIFSVAVARNDAPKPSDKVLLGTADVKQLLQLMDTDKNGKISKQEFMKFMSSEFDRLDTDKSGELDPRELAESRIQVSHNFNLAGK